MEAAGGGEAVAGQDQVPGQTIGRLRRKLGDPPVITTIPGVGYRVGALGG
jgi:DNA-binding response OmpR family regulator